MNQFTAKYGARLVGQLSGFDRLLFRGTLRNIGAPQGMLCYLSACHVLLKDFGAFVEKVSARIKSACVAHVLSLGRPVEYLASSALSKEERARQIACQHGIHEGPICVLSCVEPCLAYDLFRNRQQKHLDLVRRERRCLHLYQYQFHPTFGFMHARLQTWFPFTIQVCINGREWLARQMDAAGLRYVRQDNCIVWVEDFDQAQALLDAQLHTDWPAELAQIAAALNPVHDQLFSAFRSDYYWSSLQSEWATDLLFGDDPAARRLYSRLLLHGMSALGSEDVLRFLGRRLTATGGVLPSYQGEVTTDLKRRADGVRLKHWADGNTIKLYDKAHTEQGCVLRVETTVYNERGFRVFRPTEGGAPDQKRWLYLRRGVADLWRRAEVSQKANDRYLNALASVDTTATLGEAIETLTRPTQYKGKRVRALRPFDPDDMKLLEAVSRGEFVINGLRNRDLVRLLYTQQIGEVATAEAARRRSSCVTRKLRLLRAHGIIEKVAHTHRYQVSTQGRAILTALFTARQTPINALLPQAA